MDVDEVRYDAADAATMMQFYKRLYPYKSIFTWLNHQHAPTRLFTFREFAFTLPGDVYIRYNSFNSVEEFKRQVIRMNPSRFEIGAIYNIRPRDKKMRPGAISPLLRELVFDVDMTDYDDIRTCCTGKGICKRCWGFIAAAVKVLDQSLRSHFGYKHLLWVYSGRRGIHCWVSDEEAMSLTDGQRKAVMGWLEVIKGGINMAKKVDVRVAGGALHPSLQEALDVLRNEFSDLILEDQDCFASKEQTDTLLEILNDSELTAILRKKWSKNYRTSKEKWADVMAEITRIGNAELRRIANTKDAKDNEEKPKLQDTRLWRIAEDIIIQYTYPRIDAEVSKHRNHLLKAPFCVHPSTGRVCVPVDATKVDEFDPDRVPTVDTLLKELNGIGKRGNSTGGDGEVQQTADDAQQAVEWEKTSMKPYVDMLDAHVRGLMEEVRRRKRENGVEVSLDY